MGATRWRQDSISGTLSPDLPEQRVEGIDAVVTPVDDRFDQILAAIADTKQDLRNQVNALAMETLMVQLRTASFLGVKKCSSYSLLFLAKLKVLPNQPSYIFTEQGGTVPL
ncbi:hypothetical protein NDU88_006312 [Pleurodeles waltl]|uniref:Uncharacterized protein n=1 Tax=Pleurodeles waltl TaxID=8319 RepID=A0AAV7VME8_PLEWA|nr:hypothetical protein NDU88_006312 [Pleurodeles waltl]